MPRITELNGYTVGVGEGEVVGGPEGPLPVKVLVFTDARSGEQYKVYLPEKLREEVAAMLSVPVGSGVQIATQLPPGLRNGNGG